MRGKESRERRRGSDKVRFGIRFPAKFNTCGKTTVREKKQMQMLL
jgi:hypothetical protein